MNFVTITAYHTMRNGVRIKKLVIIDSQLREQHMVADSTDMARLWGKVRKAQGGRSARDIG